MGADAGGEASVPAGDGLSPESLFLPELGAVVEELVAAPAVVDQQVEPAVVVAGDAVDGGAGLVVIGMIALDGDGAPAGGGHGIGGLADRARQPVAAAAGRAAGHVDGRAGLAQTHRDPLADAAAGAGDQADSSVHALHEAPS